MKYAADNFILIIKNFCFGTSFDFNNGKFTVTSTYGF